MSKFTSGKLYKLKAGLGIGFPKEHFFCAVYEEGNDWGGETVEIDKNSVLMYVKSFSFRDFDEGHTINGEPVVHYYTVKMDVFLLGEMFVQIDTPTSAGSIDILEPV